MKTGIENLNKEAIRHGTDPEELLQLGRDNLSKGDYKGARLKFRLALLYNPRLASKVALYYESILDDDPANINARLSIADLHLYMGEIDGATSELEEILDVAPDRADVYKMLGKLYVKQGDIDSAISLLESAIGSGIKSTNLEEMLAASYMEKGRMEEAISLYKGLLAIDPDNKNYLRTLGQLQARVNMPEDCAKSFYTMLNKDISSISEVIYKLEELKKNHPNNIYVKEMLANVYIKAIKPTLAAAELDAILGIDSGFLDRVILKYKDILDKFPDEPSTLKALAKAFAQKGSFSEAVNEYGKLMKYSDEYLNEAVAGFRDILFKFPGQVHAHESLGDAYLKLARIDEALLEYLEVLKLNAGAARSIIDKCLKIAKANPNMVLVHQLLGQAYIISGDATHAIEEAEFIIYIDKNNAPGHQIMGDAYMKTGDHIKAKDAYATAMGIDPYNIDLHGKYESACVALLKGEIDKLKKRIEEDPWKLSIHLDIAKLYLLAQDFEQGVKELQTAVKDTGRAPFAYNLLGLAFVETGRFDLAASQFERSLEVMPRELADVSKTVRFNLGAALEAAGDVTSAITQYETILAEAVDFPGLQDRIKNIAGFSQESQRNKLIAAVIEQLGGKLIIGMWGQDTRHMEATGDIFSVSFGQSHCNAGFEHFIKGRSKAALEEFSLAVQLDPKFGAALNNLSVLLMREARLEQAETRLQLFLSTDPGSAVLHNNIGILCYLKGDLEGAVTEISKALEIDPNLSAAYINLGDMMYLKNSAQNAISLWEKIKVNDPLSPIAQRRLAYKTVKN